MFSNALNKICKKKKHGKIMSLKTCNFLKEFKYKEECNIVFFENVYHLLQKFDSKILMYPGKMS